MGDKSKAAANSFNDAANRYEAVYQSLMGTQGLKTATDYAQKTALENAGVSALASAQGAGTQASIQARNAGMTKAQSALLGANAGAGQYSEQYGNAYNNLYGQGLANALGQFQSTGTLAQQDLRTRMEEADLEYERKQDEINQELERIGKASEALGSTGGVSE